MGGLSCLPYASNGCIQDVMMWAGPFAFLLIGAGILVFYLQRRRKQLEDLPLTEEQRQQAEALLKEGKGNNA